MNKILIINGSYRDNGITDQAVDMMLNTLESSGADVDIIFLRKCPIQFCLNCRQCTQRPGELPGECMLHDNMTDLINKIEQADAYIIISPTNLGSVTALFKRFMERLIVYTYWPWENNYPQYRKAKVKKKKAVLLSSCAAHGIMGRSLFATNKQLKMTAKTLGAETVGTLFTGLIGTDPQIQLTDKVQIKLQNLALRLL